jgi:hypothetical protein
MKTYFCPYFCFFIFTAASVSVRLDAQESSGPATPPATSPNRADHLAADVTGTYASDIVVVSDAQQQALAQARQALGQGGNDANHDVLETAIKEMERAQAALKSAQKSPDKLPAAIAAEQAAYQALLKATPREFRMRRSSNSGQGQGRSAGEPDQRQFDQLDLAKEQNRYETERQAQAAPNAQQREQTEVADRLKQLAQRQQDLNDRIRELQTSLQAAHTDQERADIQNQLKRLDDEQRQMLASVDELRQQLEQSPNASAESSARQQLDQTRTDMQRASEELQKQSASQALAAGTRAQQGMQNLGEDLRRQTSSQFSEQMRQLRSEARDMENRENEIARGLDSLNNGANHSLDDSAQRDQISRQMAQQESALTNLLAGMKGVTEQAETTEPLLSKQLYDTLRRADQAHMDNLLEMGSQLVDHAFLPQASEVEHAARTNITELTDSVTRAADSVLGSQADALRYAQTQLDDLSRQLAREISRDTNAAGQASGGIGGAQSQSNRLANAGGRASAETPQNGQDQRETAARNNAARGERDERGERNRGNGQDASNNSPNHPPQSPGATPSQGGEQAQNGENASEARGANGGAEGTAGNADRLRQIAESLGRGDRAANNGGPITGNDYAAWSQQLRDVESVLDSQDLRNQLAIVRDRVGAFRSEYRNGRRAPSPDIVREQLLLPLSQVQVWVQEELARQQNSSSLVPLDRDPVPENYSELVRKYYEKLGSAR